MLAPEEIKVDIFDLLCLRGGAPLQVFCRPDGQIEAEKMKECKTKKGPIWVKDYDREKMTMYKRLLSFYRYNHHDGRVPEADQGKQNFFEQWQNVVPHKFK